MNVVERVLSGRDGRVFLQELLIHRSKVVVQISLNIPGFPKRMGGDGSLVDAVAIYFGEKVRSRGWHVVCSIFVDNGAGSACLLEIPGADAVTLKIIGMDIEDRSWGSVLDIDVIGVGGTVHRKDLGGAERKCFVCGVSAKLCARKQKHDFALLRNSAAGLLKTGLEEMLR